LSNIALGLIAFTGALAFAFAMKTELFEWFLFYSLLAACCCAAIVIFS